MRISRQSRFVRWCWWTADEGAPWPPPCHTSICVLFWRGFVLSPAAALLVAGVPSFLLYQVGTTPIALWVLGGVVSAIFLPIWAITMKRRLWPVFPAEHRQPSVVLTVLVERARAAKKKVCPLVELY